MAMPFTRSLACQLAGKRSAWKRWSVAATLILTLTSAITVQAQPARELPAIELNAIELTGERDDCLSQRPLHARVTHYLSSSPASDVLVQMQIRGDSVEFLILRDGERLARRRFEDLPKPCADRRDTLALAIALALEHAAAPGSPAPETAPDADNDTHPAADPARAAERSAAQVGATSSSASGRASPVGEPTQRAQPRTNAAPGPESDDTSARAPPARPASSRARAQSDEHAHKQSGVSPPPERAVANEREPGASAPRHAEMAVLAGARLLLGVLPVRALALSAGLELPLSSLLSVELSGVISPSTRAELRPGRVEMLLWAGETLGCASKSSNSLRVHGCLGLAAGALHARGDGYGDDLESKLGWIAGLMRVGLRWSFATWAAAQLTATGYANFVRPQLRVQDAVDTLATPRAGGALGLDLVAIIR